MRHEVPATGRGGREDDGDVRDDAEERGVHLDVGAGEDGEHLLGGAASTRATDLGRRAAPRRRPSARAKGAAGAAASSSRARQQHREVLHSAQGEARADQRPEARAAVCHRDGCGRAAARVRLHLWGRGEAHVTASSCDHARTPPHPTTFAICCAVGLLAIGSSRRASPLLGLRPPQPHQVCVNRKVTLVVEDDRDEVVVAGVAANVLEAAVTLRSTSWPLVSARPYMDKLVLYHSNISRNVASCDSAADGNVRLEPVSDEADPRCRGVRDLKVRHFASQGGRRT